MRRTGRKHDNSRHKESRQRRGDIPDTVSADHEYMSTVSSFSEGTSTYLQETWRKPSRDLLDYFSSTRALDMNYPSTKHLHLHTQGSKVKQNHGLFEA